MIFDIKTSTGSENTDGDVTCTMKFKVPRNSEDLDRWFWFCKNHACAYDMVIFDGGFAMVEKSLALPEGQTTLDVEDSQDDGSAVIVFDDDNVGHLAEEIDGLGVSE